MTWEVVGLGSKHAAKKERADKLLARWRDGDQEAFNKLFAMLHGDFLRDAHHKVKRERANLTLQTGDLVNKLYIKLAQAQNRPWQDLTHFERSAASAMKHMLIDHARGWIRRGDGKSRVIVDHVDLAPILEDDHPERYLELAEIMNEMETLDPTMTKIFSLKFLLGLTLAEIAEELNVPINKAKREWQMATRFINERLGRK